MFSEGREDVNDEERAGRPSTSTTDKKINKVEKMILANRRITVREVAEDLNISIGSCHSIFINDLGMRRVAAKFVPKLLNCHQKQHRMNIANEMLDSVRKTQICSRGSKLVTKHLAPCDFFLFPKLKRPMNGRRYATLDEIKTASKEELKRFLKNDFLKCFEDWKNRWHKCIISHGDYFEGNKVAAPNMECIDCSSCILGSGALTGYYQLGQLSSGIGHLSGVPAGAWLGAGCLKSATLGQLIESVIAAMIQPPETFDFSTPNEWPKWRKRFEQYLVVSGMKKKEEADKIDLFMYLMGDRADDIFRTFKFEKEEEATKIDSVLKAFDSHFCVRKNIIYERAKFNSRIQEDREPVDEFITSLYKLADSCEFEGLHEQLSRDRIVRPSTSQKVNQVKFNSKKQSPKQQQQQPSKKKETSAKTGSRCPKCGGFTHREGQACRAEGQRCNLCSKTSHFANCCPDKQAKNAEVKAVSTLDEEIGFLLEVSAVEDSSNLDDDEGECRRRWTAEIQVNGKQVKFKLDSQADVTCVPLCLFKKIMGQQRLVESDINIRAAEFSELQTVGMFISTLRNGNYEIKEKIYVIRRLSEPLLSRRACELLNLARRIEVVATRINPIKDEMLTKIFEAQQEDTTLKAVVNYLEQGWPDKKMSQALLSYWNVKDELGVQNGLLMRSCRLVIPASMKLEILDKLHAGHFGITKTRLRARETVWWPGISEEIAETVRKCSVCIQEAVSKHEPLIPTNFPTRPWQKIGMDLFKFENKWYLVVIDYYSRFPEMIQLDGLTASVVVRSCKSIFARHGIPETVVSDNGTQFGAAREFANFARQYGFKHVTSSPRFPQSNGMAEAGVKIAKLILKKNQDPSLGLLEYRSTPLENGCSPAELLMGRKLRTTLPIAPENLNTKLVDSQTLKRKEGRRRKDMKSRYDRRCGATDMEELSEGDTVWITDMRTWGIVKQKASTPRSYMVDTPVGTLRRNRFHLRKGVTVQYPADPSTLTFSGEELVENEKTPVVDYPSNDSEDGQIRTRSERIVKPVDRLHY
ncbi:K02A2.6-like [Cordylochernes scorpioides]|uniref:RNA-directed DNA polymerase n=1 Tax=Cordylochernes scorpioides TaxID=51811 RepID=A0ABY6K6I3_9ARAC|nr:K02A2.6-like [Cordylochernes scorpioides]